MNTKLFCRKNSQKARRKLLLRGFLENVYCATSMNKKEKRVLSAAMSILGSRTSARKKITSAQNAKKAREQMLKNKATARKTNGY
jgi:hypothetical protein